MTPEQIKDALRLIAEPFEYLHETEEYKYTETGHYRNIAFEQISEQIRILIPDWDAIMKLRKSQRPIDLPF